MLMQEGKKQARKNVAGATTANMCRQKALKSKHISSQGQRMPEKKEERKESKEDRKKKEGKDKRSTYVQQVRHLRTCVAELHMVTAM